jgi:ubiquinone/menaquinone biosynthesis C-methylase UbiE
MNTKQYWNSVADKKEFTAPLNIEIFKKAVGKDARILDAGCGCGRTVNELYRSGYKNLTGIDFSEKMIECAKHLCPFAQFYVKKGTEIAFPDKSFDAVLLFAVLTCVINDKDQQELIKEIKRVLKPGGVVYINDFLLNGDARNTGRYEAVKDKYGKYGVFELPGGALLRHHDERYIRQILSMFDNIVFQKSVYETMNGNKANGFYFLGKK